RRGRRYRRRRRGSRPDREGLRGAARRPQRRRRDDARAAGSRQGGDRALQVPARGRIRHRVAEDADRQAAALCPAQGGGRAGRAQACILKTGARTMTPPKYVPIAPIITDDDDLPKALVLPPAWPRPVGYANGMTAKGRVIVTAGLVGWDQMGNFPDGLVAQARQLFTNMLAVLAEGGAGAEHLVRLTWYLVDLDEY